MQTFDPNCRQCPRLAQHLVQIRRKYPEYHARPVQAFGDQNARLLIVGLAPGLHGANATGRPFTGDYAGILLYATLHKYGFANQSQSVHRKDGLRLHHCRITNAVKCLPPQNKPVPDEIKLCNQFLRQELSRLPSPGLILALGTVAHKAVLMANDLKYSAYPFKHHAMHTLDNKHRLIDCYHCSRYNTQTKRLTTSMFEAVFTTIRSELEKIRDTQTN